MFVHDVVQTACLSETRTSSKIGRRFSKRVRMIRLDNVSKQNGHQPLFMEAVAALRAEIRIREQIALRWISWLTIYILTTDN